MPVQAFLAPVPFLELIDKAGLDKLMINTVSLGASFAFLNSDFKILEDLLKELFDKKGEEITTENINAARAGFEFVRNNFTSKFSFNVEKRSQENLIMGGAEAVAFGAIKAGVKFAAIYPMTPINGILTTLVNQALEYKIIVKQPEDEISGINMAIGASYAGVRSMVATSGGGFCLMTEALGLAAQSETPIVIVEGMRPGPGTGLPTWTEQGDLRFVLHAAHGEFPRIVLAPGDVLDAFIFAMNAFNLAEKYQLPVILLVDKYLMEGHESVDVTNLKSQISNFKLERGKFLTEEELEKTGDYKRYLFTSDGVSPRSIPGQKNGISISGSDEHLESGLYDETSENRKKMTDKRFKKMETASLDIISVQSYDKEDARLTVFGFGSTKMPILEAIRLLKSEGININFLNVSCLSPFPKEAVKSAIEKSEKTLVIENNKTGQFEGLIREETGLSMGSNLRKYDGRPFYPEEIAEKIRSSM